MARVTLQHQFGDGSLTRIDIRVDEDYPDALAECVARVRDLWRETCTDQAE